MADLVKMYERYVNYWVDEADKNGEEIVEIQSFEEFCDDYYDFRRD